MGSTSSCEGAIFRGEGRPIVKYRNALRSLISAKKAELIKMPFGFWARMSPRNHVLHGIQISSGKGVILRENGAPIVNVYGQSALNCAKRLNRSICRLGVDSGGQKGAQVQPYSTGGANVRCPHGLAHWRHLAHTTEPSVCCGDAALCQITLTTC